MVFGLAFLSKAGGGTLMCLKELFQVSLRGHVCGNSSLRCVDNCNSDDYVLVLNFLFALFMFVPSVLSQKWNTSATSLLLTLH